MISTATRYQLVIPDKIVKFPGTPCLYKQLTDILKSYLRATGQRDMLAGATPEMSQKHTLA